MPQLPVLRHHLREVEAGDVEVATDLPHHHVLLRVGLLEGRAVGVSSSRLGVLVRPGEGHQHRLGALHPADRDDVLEVAAEVARIVGGQHLLDRVLDEDPLGIGAAVPLLVVLTGVVVRQVVEGPQVEQSLHRIAPAELGAHDPQHRAAVPAPRRGTLVGLARRRVVAQVDLRRVDDPGVHVVDAVIDDHHVGLEVEDTELEVHQTLPGRVASATAVDHLDLVEAELAQALLELDRIGEVDVVDPGRIGGRPAEQRDAEDPRGLRDRDLVAAKPARVVPVRPLAVVGCRNEGQVVVPGVDRVRQSLDRLGVPVEGDFTVRRQEAQPEPGRQLGEKERSEQRGEDGDDLLHDARSPTSRGSPAPATARSLRR